MKHLNPLYLITTSAVILFTAVLFACTPKKISTSLGDTQIYNDDSEINMKTTERKSKMPFDTTAVPPVRQVKYETR